MQYGNVAVRKTATGHVLEIRFGHSLTEAETARVEQGLSGMDDVWQRRSWSTTGSAVTFDCSGKPKLETMVKAALQSL